MDQFDEDEYECFTCRRRFHSAVFSISREWNRVHYDSVVPEVEITGSEGLECYCSEACAASRRSLVMANESVPISYPDIGPVETCSKCRAPVDMAEFHVTYLESYDVHRGANALETVRLKYLAVLCRRCQPWPSDRVETCSRAHVE